MSNSEMKLLVARAAIWRTSSKDELLVGQRPQKSSNYKNRWEFPGGKVDQGEEPSLSAVREVKEETNLNVIRYFPDEKLRNTYVMETHDTDGQKFGFGGFEITTDVIEALAINPHALFALPPEHQSLRWASLEEAQELNLIPQADFALPYLVDQQRRQRLRPSYFAVTWPVVRQLHGVTTR